MTTERPYDYPGAPLHVTGRDNLSVELAYGTDDVELTFDVDAATWIGSTRKWLADADAALAVFDAKEKT